MFRTLLFTLFICMLAACNVPPSSPPQPTPLVAEVDPEEYALFSAMIDQGVVGWDQGESILILEQTRPHIDDLEFALEGPYEPPKELVEAYRMRNEQPYTLDSIVCHWSFHR